MRDTVYFTLPLNHTFKYEIPSEEYGKRLIFQREHFIILHAISNFFYNMVAFEA